MTSGGINHHVDVRKWKRVLGTCFVEIGVVDAYSPLLILLSHYDNISEPVGLLNLMD